ncbi:MAG TPA: isoleucine--tRNA ligase [Streptosporangiaceae bacterium]|nr:isoleucine--tRNA ligase [Streptosporangiaceae bacterium]
MTERPDAQLYQPVAKVPDRVAIERDVLARWESSRVFDRLREQTSGGEPFSLLDGPITANNPMGVHHAWGRTMKDVIGRYQAMNGRQLRWQNGFDCQGLWVEVEVEKSLGFNSRREIEAFGLDRFAGACRERVATYARRITEQSARLGMWMDWDRSYYTMTDTNISYIWGFLAECHRRGWLYRGHRLMPWCHRCGTSLSQHELADAYDELTHPSVVFLAPLADGSGEALAVWTTTPWTLPANVAVAVDPAARYALVRTRAGDVWAAQARAGRLPATGPVVRVADGADLVGRAYRPLLPGLPAQQQAARAADPPSATAPPATAAPATAAPATAAPATAAPATAAPATAHRVVGWAGVSTAEGTGLVHIAPGCGAEDFELGRELGLPVLAPIGEDGRYGDGYGWLAGRHVTDADTEIIEHLADDGLLLHAGTVRHRYPRCWRCATPLVHRVVDEWFIASGPVRAAMREAAATVDWHPAHMGRRMDDWLANMGDWCISRKRYWGLPLPFYLCPAGHLTVIGSATELAERAVAGTGPVRELHRPWVDAVTVACRDCGAGAARVPEVGDCWLDAGIVAFSTLGWGNQQARPGGYAAGAGEGLTRADLPDHGYWQRWFPAEVVCEMQEQVRLWFYSLLFMSVVLDGRAPYRSVLAYGRVSAADGREMHKSSGNAIWFDDAVAKVGADTMRWLYASQPPARDLRFGYGPARQAARRFLAFWNSCAFFVTYASLDAFRPPGGLRERGPGPDGLAPVDRWLLARVQQLVRQCRAGLDRLDLPAATTALDRFADDLSNWYVRSTRERFWDSGDTPGKAAAYQTLWYALVTAVRCLAPVMPFVADEIWHNLVAGVDPGAPDSVHLDRYPEVIAALDDAEALAAMDDARQVTELGRAARSAAGIRRRQPLPVMLAASADARRRDRLAGLADLVARECNVKELRVAGRSGESGPGEVAAGSGGAVVAGGAWEVVAAGGWEVALDTAVTPELGLEGRARDLVRRIQRLRKERDLAVTARIDVTVPADEAEVVTALGSWVAEQTLARSLTPGPGLDLAVIEPG